MSENGNGRIEKACEDALEKFDKIGTDEYAEIKSKLEFVLGSYRYDGNPVGLYEVGRLAYDALKAYKEEKPRQVSKKLLDEMEKALAEEAQTV